MIKCNFQDCRMLKTEAANINHFCSELINPVILRTTVVVLLLHQLVKVALQLAPFKVWSSN